MSSIFRWLFRLALLHPRYTGFLIQKKIRLLQRYKWIHNNSETLEDVPPPLIYKLILTEGCNLRCKMCWYWGETGIYTQSPSNNILNRKAYASLDINIFKNFISQVSSDRPSFILTGGEPMNHPQFREILGILKKEKLFATMCTNGYLLEKNADLFCSNPYIDLLVSLDGLENQNDEMRGNGVYKKVTQSIKKIKAMKNAPHLGIQCTVSPENVGNLYSFCEEMVSLGVDWILLNTGWFLTIQESDAYEARLLNEFNVRATSHLGYTKPYPLNADIFASEFRKIKNKRWPIQIASYFKDPVNDIYDYLSQADRFKKNRLCLKQWLRMDIVQDGNVVACGTYPDFSLGNIHDQKVMDIWNSNEYKKFRTSLKKEMLPICSKCNALYLYDDNKKHL